MALRCVELIWPHQFAVRPAGQHIEWPLLKASVQGSCHRRGPYQLEQCLVHFAEYLCFCNNAQKCGLLG